jgi:hypothetical protein
MRSRIIKAGYLIIIAATVVALVGMFGDSNPSIEGSHYGVGPNSQSIQITVWNTRNVRVVMDVSPATSRINVYLLDEEGIQVFNDEMRVQPVLSLEHVDGCDFTYQPRSRGVYAFIVQNEGSQTAKIDQRVIHQGFEWDILQILFILGIIGVAMVLLPRFPLKKVLKITQHS